ARTEQTDAAGNTGFSAARTFAITQAPPPGPDLTLPIVSLNALPAQTSDATRSGSGSWSVEAATLAPGTYSARAEQGDLAGNLGLSAVRTFTITTVTNAVAWAWDAIAAPLDPNSAA